MGAGLALALFLAALPAAAAPLPVDLELVIAVDISGSIDAEEAKLQRNGYIAALTDPAVIAAVVSGPMGRIAATYVEWSGFTDRRVIAEWHLIDGPESARAFAGVLAEAPLVTGRRTSISGAILFGIQRLAESRFEGTRRVIDISGDGPNNDGDMISGARDAALAQGVTINGLPIINDRPSPFGMATMPDLDLYYEECVIGGPAAFIVVAEGFASFATAIRRKLLLEIAQAPPAVPPPRLGDAALIPVAYSPACDAGERMLRDSFRRGMMP
ncbi:MAG: DUF1194 domain-containing protein [Alphaproteobacteria bacterium]|nr:DUF1194 domain-containing protein [Alphaproteobacteria bacterium]